MRYALLADIHANLPALEAVLEDAGRAGVDGYLCAGDLVGYGPHPNECIARIAALGAPCVAGNHDLMALGQLSSERCIRLARRILPWTCAVLTEESRAYLEALPGSLSLPGGILLAHGTPDDPCRYLTRPEEAADLLARLPEAKLLVVGHTHRPWLFCPRRGTLSLRPGKPAPLPEDGPALLNPGSVGQAREWRALARYVVLDLRRNTAELRSLTYDTAACRAALRRAGLPPHACHLRPSPLAPVRRCARAVLRTWGRLSLTTERGNARRGGRAPGRHGENQPR